MVSWWCRGGSYEVEADTLMKLKHELRLSKSDRGSSD